MTRRRSFENGHGHDFQPDGCFATSVGTLEPVNDDILYEVVDNQIRELPPMSAGRRIRSTLFEFSARLPGTRVLATSMRCSLDHPSKNLSAVRFVIRLLRALAAGRRSRTPTWDVVPNLAIEVVSPTNTANEVIEKIKDYFEAGVERVWVIYPEFAEIYDYDSPTSVHILTRNQTLDGGTVLPGFQLPLTELFEDESDPEMDAGA